MISYNSIHHCSAIALAIQGNVLLLFFALSFHHLLNQFQGTFVLGGFSRISVGTSRGKFFNHKHVFFWYGSQKWYGCIVWSYFLIQYILLWIGFSIAILSIGEFISFMKNSFASSHCWYRSWLRVHQANRNLAQAFDRYVHGGWAIIISYFPLYASATASHCMCHSGCHHEHSWISHEYASIHSFRIAIVIAWLSSQAIRTFIMTFLDSNE